MIIPKCERLKEVYAYVRQHFDIHTQADFAKALNMTRPALSAAMNGNEAYLTENLFRKICGTFQGIFNLDYLLTGRGELTLQENKKDVTQISDSRNVTNDPHLDLSSFINAIIAAKDAEIAAKDALIAEKDNRLAEKDEYIASLKSEIKLLQKSIAESQLDNIEKYPYSIGAAEAESATIRG